MPEMTSLQIREEIERLEKRAKELEAAEVKEVIARIRVAIRHYRLTPDDLFKAGVAEKTPRATSKKPVATAPTKTPAEVAPVNASAPARNTTKGIKVPPKFKDANGNVWSGRGTMPRWLAAEVAAGKTVHDFAI